MIPLFLASNYQKKYGCRVLLLIDCVAVRPTTLTLSLQTQPLSDLAINENEKLNYGMSFIGDGDDSALTYFKVLHSGGLVVRSEPNLTSQSTGRVISCDSIVTTRKNLWKDGDNFFIEVSEGGWVVVKRGVLNACARISGPDIKIGEWSYEVIHPSGSRFAKSPNISEASDRYDRVHQKGTVIKAIRKRTDIGSVITMVQLEADCGWIFEHASTGQVLDRLGNELVVIPIDSSREFRLDSLIWHSDTLIRS